MSSSFGNKIKYSIFGESHGSHIGIVLDNLKSGIKIDYDYISKLQKRRSPVRKFSSNRKETDSFEIISGIKDGYSAGTPICVIIKNKDANTKDYDDIKDKLRPSHGDFSQRAKYGENALLSGGGHASGRLTAAIVIAGGIISPLIKKEKIGIYYQVMQIGDILEKNLEIPSIKDLEKLKDYTIPMYSKDSREKSENLLKNLIQKKDSVGLRARIIIKNLKKGIGSPFFDSLESKISSLIFSIPAVKSISFGLGEEFASKLGSEVNDEFYIENDKIRTKTNYSGGINAGISNGMDIIFEIVFRPTPSIAIKQKTVNIKTMEESEIEIKGRHDPVVGIRALPVVEAILNMAIYDSI